MFSFVKDNLISFGNNLKVKVLAVTSIITIIISIIIIP